MTAPATAFATPFATRRPFARVVKGFVVATIVLAGCGSDAYKPPTPPSKADLKSTLAAGDYATLCPLYLEGADDFAHRGRDAFDGEMWAALDYVGNQMNALGVKDELRAECGTEIDKYLAAIDKVMGPVSS